MTEEKENPLKNALAVLPDVRRYVAADLRQMAEAQPPYEHFCIVSPLAKAIWYAAAELIEESVAQSPPRMNTNRHE